MVWGWGGGELMLTKQAGGSYNEQVTANVPAVEVPRSRVSGAGIAHRYQQPGGRRLPGALLLPPHYLLPHALDLHPQLPHHLKSSTLVLQNTAALKFFGCV